MKKVAFLVMDIMNQQTIIYDVIEVKTGAYLHKT